MVHYTTQFTWEELTISPPNPRQLGSDRPNQLVYVCYVVIVHDGLKTVGDSEDGAVTECFGDGLLDEGIGLHIHRRSHLIHQKQFALAKKSPCKAHKLALPHGEILPALDDRDVEFVVGLLKHVPQVRLLKRAPDRLVRRTGSCGMMLTRLGVATRSRREMTKGVVRSHPTELPGAARSCQERTPRRQHAGLNQYCSHALWR
eukprot:gene4449-biopygen4896